MAFKKLSLYVGAALIIFLIITANIVVWGMIENKILMDIERRPCPVVVKEVINNYTTITQVNGTTTKGQTETTPTPTPTNPDVNTRAS